MNRLFAGLIAAPLFLSVPAQAQDVVPLETLDQKFSYMIGLQLGSGMKQQGFADKLDMDAFIQAMRDVFAGAEPRLSQQEMEAVVGAMQSAKAAEQEQATAKARAEGQGFLAGNKMRDGVMTTASGLQYVVVEEGSGAKPAASDMVKVHYEGKLLDGTVFDSSIKRGEPATFGVGQVIPGWQEALQLMSVGSKWEVWIPSDLAYGAQGAGGAIGPHQVLHFQIELIEIVEK